MSFDGSDGELVAIEAQRAGDSPAAGASRGPRSGRRVVPSKLDLTLPPRASNSAGEGSSATRREERHRSRTSCLKLSDKAAFLHVERMGFGGYDTNVERFQGRDATASPSPMPARNPSPTSGQADAAHPRARAPGGGEEARLPLSRQSSLNSIEWGESGLGESGRAVETPPCAPGAFEASGRLETPPSRAGRSGCASASDLQALCRAPRQSRQTLVSRSSSQRGGAGSAAHTSSSHAISTDGSADTAPNPSPFPRRPVWGELANMPAWGDVLASSAAVQAQLVRVRVRVRVRVG